MRKYQSVFDRYEKKYMLYETEYQALFQLIKHHLVCDAHQAYTISNIYLDTDDFQVIGLSLDKPLFKEKIRIRSYGIPTQDSCVYLEIKKKFKGIVNKRRIELNLTQAKQYLQNQKIPEISGQIGQEIDWIKSRHELKPKVFIAYDRVAYASPDCDLRITFDRNVRWRTDDLDLAQGDQGERLLDAERVLMEIKVQNSMPLWLSNALSTLCIYPTSFSKYGTCYKTMVEQGKSAQS